MLSLLHIENIAVIEQAEITFQKGFNVLSGETGAGKSIIIDAIGAILGERAYRESIRTGADKAFVSAVFCGVTELPWFEENHVPYDDELLLQREIYCDGRNICRANGQAISVGVLRTLGRQLISVHGQHDSQQLFEEDRHLTFLDSFSGDSTLLEAYQIAYEAVRAAKKTLESLTLDEGEKLRRQETLQYQISELEQAQLRAGEEQELLSRQTLLVNAEKLMTNLCNAVTALYGDEDTRGAAELLTEAERTLGAVKAYDETIAALYQRVQELSYSVQDAAEELRDFKNSFSYSEDELDELGARLDYLHKLQRKYGGSSEEMLMYLANAKQELDDIVFSDERKAQAEKALNLAVQAAKKKADALHAARENAASEMEAQMTNELTQLNMPRVQFSCEFTQTELGATGTDAVRFLMSANMGEALKPLSKVASGGELARIMLAMKNVLARQDSIATMIFDEVDAGVSGRAAQKVAEKLLTVSKGRQVLCVTHLPQIAALAENHLLITKAERQGRTYTQVEALNRDGRIDELARMIGGAVITQTTRSSAAEMLDGAKTD